MLPSLNKQTTSSRNTLQRAWRGAAIGAAFGVVLVLVGMARAALALIGGAQLKDLDKSDVRMLAFYVSGAAVAGTVVSLLQPLMRGRISRYLGYAIGGAFFGVGLVAGVIGLEKADVIDWLVGMVIGVIAGCAVGNGWDRDNA